MRISLTNGAAAIMTCMLWMNSGVANAQEFKGMTLTVLGISSDLNASIMKSISGPFEKETGAKLNIVTGSSPANLSKLLVAKGRTPSFQVVSLENLQEAQAIIAGALQKFDYTKISNPKDLAAGAIPSPGYGPAFQFFRFGTCVNVAQYKAHNIPLPTSVDDWFNPAIVGHNILPTPSNFWWASGMQSLADHYKVPYSDPSQLFKKLLTMKPTKLYTASGDAQTQLQSGATWLAPTSDGRCFTLKLAGQPVDFVPLNLKIKGKTYAWIIGVDTWQIPAGVTGKQLQLAYKFIDLSLKPSSQVPVTKEMGFPPATYSGLKMAEALPDAKRAHMYGEHFSFDQMYTPDAKELLPVLSDWIAKWNEIFVH